MLFIRKRYEHEVFLSHAVEDREAIVDDLYSRLQAAQVDMWYSAISLKPGEDLAAGIKNGVNTSRFGVVVLTKNSLTRDWPNAELTLLESKQDHGNKVLLPILHDVTVEELPPRIRNIAEKYCLRTERGMDFVVEKILDEINAYRSERQLKKRLEWLISAFVALILIWTFMAWLLDRPAKAQIENAVNKRIWTIINMIGNKYVAPFKLQSSLVHQSKIDSARLVYSNFKSSYRNEYEFDNGFTTIHSRKNVEAVLSLDVVTLANTPGYGMDSVDIYWLTPKNTDGFRYSSFSLINKKSVTYTIKCSKEGSLYVVQVNYKNGIQFINVNLTTPPTSVGIKRHEMMLVGLPPIEIYYFEKRVDGEWYLKEVQSRN